MGRTKEKIMGKLLGLKQKGIEIIKNEEGSVLTEYGLFIAIVIVGCIAIIGDLRDAIIALIQKVIDAITL